MYVELLIVIIISIILSFYILILHSNKINDYKYKHQNYLREHATFSINETTPYAIVMLCMLKDIYALGACIGAYAHKAFINKYDLKIDLIIMCDDYIYDKYSDMFRMYFDDAIKINLVKINLHPDFNYSQKYDWFEYSLNKWKCLKLDQYKKILFIDIDMLPINKNFYNIFNQATPAFVMFYFDKLQNLKINDKSCLESSNCNKTYANYSDYTKDPTLCWVNATMALLEPNKGIYKKYKEMVYNVFKNGIYSRQLGGPDETSIFYFYAHHLKSNIYPLSKLFRAKAFPWILNPDVFTSEEKQNAYVIDYIAQTKPWIKCPIISFPEEVIWFQIYSIMSKNDTIMDLHKQLITSGYSDFIDHFIGTEQDFRSRNNDYYFKKHKDVMISINNESDNDLKYSKIMELNDKVYEDKKVEEYPVSNLLDIVKWYSEQ